MKDYSDFLFWIMLFFMVYPPLVIGAVAWRINKWMDEYFHRD